MKGDYDNNSTLGISLYKLYYEFHKPNKQAYIPNNYSFNDKDNDNKCKFILKFDD
jgi:hypothetical protein